jgi:streptomycin 6-kinase
MAWLHRLPDVVDELARRWLLTVGEPFDDGEGSRAWVAPATRADGRRVVLKLAIPHFEGQHEIQGLRFWSGDPTVHLLESDEHFDAMLLERCEPGYSLRTVPEPEQDVEMAALLRRLWRSPTEPHPFRPVSEMVARWTSEALTSCVAGSDLTLVREGCDLSEDLSRGRSTDVLLATDLHAGNVLRAERERWLVIDPKPFVGDPAYDATQHLLNCRERLHANPGNTIQRVAALLHVNPDTVRLWTFARLAIEASADRAAAALARRVGHS